MDILVAMGQRTASFATAAEALDVLEFLPGQTENMVLKLQYTNGTGVLELLLRPEDQEFLETVVTAIYNLSMQRGAIAERELKKLRGQVTGADQQGKPYYGSPAPAQ